MHADPTDQQTNGKAHDELAVFSTVVSAMATLDPAGRLRLFRTLATFFDLPISNPRSFASTESSAEIEQTTSGLDRAAPSFSEDRAPTPKQFLLEKRPQSETERIACLAYYLTHYREQAQFKTLDLSKLNTEAAQIKISNPTRAVDNAAQAHFLVSVGQGKKQLSAIGELYVQALPDRGAAKQAILEVRQRRPRQKARAGKPQRSDASPPVEENGQ